MKFGQALKHNLTHLLAFEGRDARQTFWFYVLFLIVIQFGVVMLLTIPMMVGLVVVIGFGVLRSQGGPNRYGEDPEAMA